MSRVERKERGGGREGSSFTSFYERVLKAWCVFVGEEVRRGERGEEKKRRREKKLKETKKREEKRKGEEREEKRREEKRRRSHLSRTGSFK